MLTQNRVVVTGLGVVAPNGIGKDAFWASLLKGQSGIGPITLFDASQHPSRIAGEVKGFDPAVHIGRDIKAKRIARQAQFALAACLQAIADASLTREVVAPGSAVPLILGVSSSALEVISQGIHRMQHLGPKSVPIHSAYASLPHQAAGIISEYIPFATQASTLASACPAGIDAIAAGADLIRRGKCEIALCGGTDAPINAITYAGLATAGLVSLRNDTPDKACRPFDLDRDSGVVSEGAGVVVLENLDHARSRGVRPYLEITGYATAVDPDTAVPCSGLEITMRQALANAGRHPDKVDYICAHGPGHPVIDRAETAMIKKVFGAGAYRLPISSIKAVTGSPLAAAGPMQVIACSLAVREGVIPPTANLDKPDPDCDLDYVPLKARHVRTTIILINSHGFGGGNSTLIVEQPPV
jgi:3-oxoacyl-[acyl-carrier-protein] synthase II